jgi:type IV conjugative transfer system protein TraE
VIGEFSDLCVISGTVPEKFCVTRGYAVAGKVKYLDALANAFSEARAWKLTTFVVSGLSVFLVVALIWSSADKAVVLVPAGFAESHGRVTVTPATGSGSPEYLSQIALGDLALALDWQPNDVIEQYQRFLNRLTDAQYAAQNISLMSEAQHDQANDVSQSFYPDRVYVDPPHLSVKVSGMLTRWQGDKQVLHAPAEYEVRYAGEDGYLHVESLKITQ